MSGNVSLPTYSPFTPLTPQGSLNQGNLLQTNTTLLQPIPGSFRLFETLWLLMLSTLSTTPLNAPVSMSSATEEEVIQLREQVLYLFKEVDALKARLAAG